MKLTYIQKRLFQIVQITPAAGTDLTWDNK